jgi:hypothetical protein
MTSEEYELIKCGGKGCPLREDCKRFALIRNYFIVPKELFFSPPYNVIKESCTEYIPTEERKQSLR